MIAEDALHIVNTCREIFHLTWEEKKDLLHSVQNKINE